eukprot:GHVO01048259.1.p1 GENE.GHVO01048259.1~~GHVO01048259.1.p1  ORF type:complete len:103 (+),score=13.10 GHVO01048259.1:46-309(+)
MSEVSAEKIRSAFMAFDKDCDGNLTPAEAELVARGLGIIPSDEELKKFHDTIGTGGINIEKVTKAIHSTFGANREVSKKARSTLQGI